MSCCITLGIFAAAHERHADRCGCCTLPLLCAVRCFPPLDAAEMLFWTPAAGQMPKCCFGKMPRAKCRWHMPAHAVFWASRTARLPFRLGCAASSSRRATAASAWVHLLTVNAFSGRHIFLDGLRRRLPVAHSLALSLLAGPLGLACHLVTARAAQAWRAARRRDRRLKDQASP